MVVYMTTNLINGKKYIGRDSKNNPKYLGSGPAIKKAVGKYGESNFKKVILEVCKSKDHLIEREEYWLNYYDAGKNPMFYNMHNFGLGAGAGEDHPMYGKSPSEKTRKKMSESQMGERNHMWGRDFSDEHRKKISEGVTGKMAGEKNYWFGKRGEEHPAYGRKHTEDEKRRIGLKHKGKIVKEESKQKAIKTRKERGSGVGEKNGRFKGYAVCVSGDYVGQKKTATEWGKIFKIDPSSFRLHLYGNRYKNGFDGNFFKWEHDVVL